MNIIGNFSLPARITTHLQIRLSNLPNTAIQVRGFREGTLTDKRVVIKTDMAGWQQVKELIREYDMA